MSLASEIACGGTAELTSPNAGVGAQAFGPRDFAQAPSKQARKHESEKDGSTERKEGRAGTEPFNVCFEEDAGVNQPVTSLI